ncbi:MAG: hypothetical protein KC464_01305, partial [Myxococcales bacterium]|nr:hypothetical protein [Myxococcales bacterium]
AALPTSGAATLEPTGGTIAIAGATLSVPAGALSAPVAMTVSSKPPSLDPLAALVEPEYLERLRAEITPLRLIELGPDGQTFAHPATVTLEIRADELPPGKTLADVAAVVISKDGAVDDVPVTVVGNRLSIEVPHYSMLLTAVAVGAMALVGGMAILLRGSADPMMRRDCAKWLNPASPRVQELAADAERFKIDAATGEIHLDLGRPAVGRDVKVGAHALPADKVIEHPEGDCVNFSTMYGSLLLARGYPVRLVAGTAEYRRGQKTYKGFHQWAETVVDGKPYYVDTFDPDHTRLVPMAEATRDLSLGRNRMCGKNPDGSTVGPAKYDPSWFDKLVTDSAALVARYKELQEEARAQQALCAGGSDAACNLRHQIYVEAMELRRKLNAMGVDPTK